MSKPFTTREMQIARGVALVADALQIALFPAFGEGFMSPLNDLLDFTVAAILVYLLGFHLAFLPSLIAEEVPMLNLAPTWTVAVLIVTRKGAANALPAPAPASVAKALPPA
jgi:hypothetical protein